MSTSAHEFPFHVTDLVFNKHGFIWTPTEWFPHRKKFDKRKKHVFACHGQFNDKTVTIFQKFCKLKFSKNIEISLRLDYFNSELTFATSLRYRVWYGRRHSRPQHCASSPLQAGRPQDPGRRRKASWALRPNQKNKKLFIEGRFRKDHKKRDL